MLGHLLLLIDLSRAPVRSRSDLIGAHLDATAPWALIDPQLQALDTGRLLDEPNQARPPLTAGGTKKPPAPSGAGGFLPVGPRGFEPPTT